MEAQTPGQPAVLALPLGPALFAALADPNRLTLLGRLALADGPRTVTELAGCCGVHLSGVSRHLARLREAGVVSADRQGREVRYTLDRIELVAALRRLADALETCCPAPSEPEPMAPPAGGEER